MGTATLHNCLYYSGWKLKAAIREVLLDEQISTGSAQLQRRTLVVQRAMMLAIEPDMSNLLIHLHTSITMSEGDISPLANLLTTHPYSAPMK